MGLEGISFGQLNIAANVTSNELNINSFSQNNEIKIVDETSDSQMINPDKEKEKQEQKLKKNFSRNNEEETDEELEPVIKYDLSRTERYALRVDDDTNEILIMEKSTSNIIQRIDAGELSRFINFLPDTKGAIVNRKF